MKQHCSTHEIFFHFFLYLWEEFDPVSFLTPDRQLKVCWTNSVFSDPSHLMCFLFLPPLSVTFYWACPHLALAQAQNIICEIAERHITKHFRMITSVYLISLLLLMWPSPQWALTMPWAHCWCLLPMRDLPAKLFASQPQPLLLQWVILL